MLVGHSISGGAAPIAAARAPELITGVVEIAPFTRAQAYPGRKPVDWAALAAVLGEPGRKKALRGRPTRAPRAKRSWPRYRPGWAGWR